MKHHYLLLLLAGALLLITLRVSADASTPGYRIQRLPGIEYGHVIENFPLNIQLFLLVNEHRTPFLDCLFLTIRYTGTAYFIVPVFAVVAWRRKDLVKPFVLSVITSTVIVHILKAIFWEPRPGALLAGVHNVLGLLWNSFPSADTAIAFAIGVTLMPGQPRWVKALLLLYGIAVAYERMYLGAHFPLDVLVGGLIGASCGIAALQIFQKKHMHLEEAV
jgi:membrane-associated phospholipid phosphatase